MGSSVVFKLTKSGGPDPERELERIAGVAEEDREGVIWIASRKRGAGFVAHADSRLLAFARVSGTDVLALTARIVARHDRLPEDALVRDMYEAYAELFTAYWRIRDVRLRRTPVGALPGTTLWGKSIGKAFGGSLSFAYWKPGLWPGGAELPVPEARVSTDAAVPSVRKPARPLHGVDFSGAREVEGRNGKLWIASWDPDDGVTLECGADPPGFGRAGLAEKILERGGLWVLDFPFGPPARVAAAAGWATWRDYLAWCDGEATQLRDGLRRTLKDAGVGWSTRRAIDRAREATWFPFFEQLYRQTISGGRDVLRALAAAGATRAGILPFDRCAGTDRNAAEVVEGFPGWTLRQCGLRATGYKRRDVAARQHRTAIVNSLRRSGIPISDVDARRAVDDVEGDAVDALVLLLAAVLTSARSASEWRRAATTDRCMEGWFFD